jgi:hypothetical protein
MGQQQRVADPARSVQLPQRYLQVLVLRLEGHRVVEPGHALGAAGEVGHELVPGGEAEQFRGVLALAHVTQRVKDLPDRRELLEHLLPAPLPWLSRMLRFPARCPPARHDASLSAWPVTPHPDIRSVSPPQG